MDCSRTEQGQYAVQLMMSRASAGFSGTRSSLFAACLVLAAVTLLNTPAVSAASLVLLHGDRDGFGFNNTSELLDKTGALADSNGNGVLEPGESLPDTSGDGRVDPAADDGFNNRSNDAPWTDGGFVASEPVTFTFNYTLPTDARLVGAVFRIVLADGSLIDRALHDVTLDGESTGVVIVPRSPAGDGEITETVVSVSRAQLELLTDGTAVFGINYSADAIDDIAIDFAELRLLTSSGVEAAHVIGVLGTILLDD